MKEATQWRRHSTETILAGQAFENNLLDIQRGMRGYVTVGDTNALASFYNSKALEPNLLKHLVLLTVNDPGQLERLKILGLAVNSLLSFDNRSIVIYRSQGFSGTSKLDATGESRLVFGRARDILNQFLLDEEQLSDLRDTDEQSQYHDAGRLLVVGSILAAVLLLLATYQANRELTFRRQTEAKLKETMLVQNAILGSADYGIVATNCEGIVQVFNPAAGRLLGYFADEVIGRTTPMLWRDPLELAERAEMLSRKLDVPVNPSFDVVIKKIEADMIDEGEWTFIRKDGSRFPSLLVVTPLANEAGNTVGYVGIFRDISERKKSEREREELIAELKKTLAHVKTLSGLIPICAWCKSVRSDTGYWQSVEQYVRMHSDASFSHGMCPSCAEKFKNDIRRGNGNSKETLLSKT
ncbi:MAG TPA: PAS domain S-box protein [Pseudomonadales bacterium]|nr:PAS domain S-box protein [Pseudomonadales bacterium]